MLIFAISCIAEGAAAIPAISFSPSSVTLAPGESADVAVILSEAPNGLAGYELTLSAPVSIVRATGATFPSWATLNNKKSKPSGYTISGVDINKAVQSGSTGIQLATVTFTGNTSGSTSVAISGLKMSADGGNDISPALGTLSVKVTGSTTATTTVTATTTTAATTATTTATTTTTTAEETTAVTTAETTAPVVIATTSTVKGMPVAGFTAKPGYGKPPLSVQFYDRSDGSPVSWEWDFGDGGTSLAQNPAYTYRDEGRYTVTLKVTNTIGSSKVSRESYVIVSNTYIPPPTTEPVTEESTTTTTLTTVMPATTKTVKTNVPTTATRAPLEPFVSVIGIGAVLAGSALYSRRQGR